VTVGLEKKKKFRNIIFSIRVGACKQGRIIPYSRKVTFFKVRQIVFFQGHRVIATESSALLSPDNKTPGLILVLFWISPV